MKQFFLILILWGLGYCLLAQVQPGLHVDEDHTVLFGKDTISSGIKLLWYPSKAAFRAGKTNTTEWIYNNVGPFSAAFGTDTEARGNYSSAFGLSTWALSYGETSVGRYSLGGGNATSWLGTDPLFEVGNGSGTSARANAFTVYKNGNAEFQRSIKLGDHIGSSVSNGSIRYNGSDIQGRVGGVWQSLTSGNGSGGTTPWSTSGSNVYYNNGNVGIGTLNPQDNLYINGGGSVADEIGISLRQFYQFGSATYSKVGRLWQSASSLNLGILGGDAELKIFDSTIRFESNDFTTFWGFNFHHGEGNFNQDYRNQTWLKKSWRSDLGDYLYLGSTGNRPINNQHAMVLSQTGGIQFGKGNTNDGNGLGSDIIKMTIGSVNTMQSTSPMNIYALNDVVSFYRNGESGGVTIGSNDLPTGYRLAVDGRIASEEVLVQLSGNWPDYVFEEEYDLMDLDQLESFIRKNNHLPGVPTASEVKEDGIEVGEMQKMQMEKIEELTLYIIELQKEIKKLKSKVDGL